MNMLTPIKRLALLVFLALGPSFAREAAAQPGVTVPVESFYNELSPYGQWMQYPGYGNVWLPNAGPDFQPYASAGHWVMTEYGNTWVSDYAWGWAPFHYGRWIYDPAYGGWLWVPGSDWAPAWVSWRSGGGYYGWAPLAPGWDINVNINIPSFYWNFVPQIYITSPNLYSYCVPRPRVVNVYQQTTIINNYYRGGGRAYAYGPPRGDIERITRQNVPVYRIDHMDRPGRSVVGNGSVGFYRPGSAVAHNPGRDYNGGFNNSPRREYDGTAYNRGGRYNGDFNNNRPNYDGGSNAPNRDYPNRDYSGGMSRGNGFPTERNGGFNSNNGGFNNPSSPNSANSPAPSPVPAPNRGNYSPGNSPQGDNGFSNGGRMGGYEQRSSPQERSFPRGGFQQQPNRSFERVERQPQMNSQPMQGGQNGGGGFQRMQESRPQSFPQPSQGQPQQGGGGGFGERHQRGPR